MKNSMMFAVCAVWCLACFVCRAGEQSRGEVSIFRDGLPHIKDAVAGGKVYMTCFGDVAYPGKNGSRNVAAFPGKWIPVKSGQGTSLKISTSPDLGGYGDFPGFLIIDTFAHDTGMPEEQVRKALQYARNRIPAQRDAVLIYSPGKNFPEDMESPAYRKIHAVYEEFAQKNGIPSLDVAAELCEGLRCGRFSLADCKNPARFSAIRQKLADKMLTELIRDSLSRDWTPEQWRKILEKRKAQIKKNILRQVSYDVDSYPDGWLPWQFSPMREIPHVLVGTGKNSFSYSFKGSAIGLSYLLTPESGDFLISVDDSDWEKIEVPSASSIEQRELLLQTDLIPEKDHLLQIRMIDPVKKFFGGNFLIADHQDFISISSISGLDAFYARIPPLKFKPEFKVLNDLPKTHDILTKGKPLSILLLGDSIMNGIRSSNFQLLLQEMYPKSRISVAASVRGSTGCWYYQAPQAFQTYVGSKNFDLLIIGGISHQNDVGAIRKVVDMARSSHPAAEILLMTDAWGFRNLMNPEDSRFDCAPTEADDSYQGKLLKLRKEYDCGVAFMDITTPWAHYLRTCGVPYEVFKGDKVHANFLGNQLLARIIEAYFAPEGYDPLEQWKLRKKNCKLAGSGL